MVNQLAGPPLPPNSNAWPTGVQDMLTGLKNGSGAAKGSGEESIAATSESFTFDTTAFTVRQPVMMEVRFIDGGATPANAGVAGRIAFSTDGVSNADTIFFPVGTSGDVFDVTDVFAAGGTIYARTENAPAGTAKFCYRFITGRVR